MPDQINPVTLEQLEETERVLKASAKFTEGNRAKLYLLAAENLRIDRLQMILLSQYMDQNKLAMS